MKKNIIALSLLATCLSASSHLHAMDQRDQIMEQKPLQQNTYLMQLIKRRKTSEQELERINNLIYQELDKKLRAQGMDGLRSLEGKPPLAQDKTGRLLSLVLDDLIFHTNNKKRN